jgi:hypothetical protein
MNAASRPGGPVDGEGARLGAEAARRLAQSGRADIGPGLTKAEFARVERDYGFEFADDHRAFLAAGLPLNPSPGPRPQGHRSQEQRPRGPRPPGRPPAEQPTPEGRPSAPGPWPDWRDGDPADLRQRLAWPVEGVLFDVERNAYWHPSWGRRPADPGHALSAARRHLAQAPAMIPVYSHRYLPAGRLAHGHPVLSIYQTDIIVYGTDLPEYVTNEFTERRHFIAPDWTPPPLVPFWSDFV